MDYSDVKIMAAIGGYIEDLVRGGTLSAAQAAEANLALMALNNLVARGTPAQRLALQDADRRLATALGAVLGVEGGATARVRHPGWEGGVGQEAADVLARLASQEGTGAAYVDYVGAARQVRALLVAQHSAADPRI